jgi:hypothetical protein
MLPVLRFVTPKEPLHMFTGQVFLTLKYLIFSSKVQQAAPVMEAMETIETA